MGLLTSQPGKALWTLFAVAFAAARMPLWIVYFLSPSLRQHPKWSFAQAIKVQITSVFLYHASVVEMKTPLSLAPGVEKERWSVAQPAKSTLYVGPANSDPDVQPEAIGGTWYPAKPSASARPSYVVLHLHGGAFVIGDGRTKDAGFAAKTLIANTDASHVFAPQYRLSSNPGCRFPAQLQDAITAYAYLVNVENIAPQKIIFSGDSAGANLALSLVRYLSEHGTSIGLRGPLCVWLWSPWVNPVGSLTTAGFDSSPHVKTDYVNGQFGRWGAQTLKPSPKSGLTLASGYISFKDNQFATETPIYISAGECEVLYHDCVDLYEQMKAVKGNQVQLQIEEHCVHDTILTGKIVGFEKEANQSAKRVGKWLQTLISASS